MDEVEYLLFNKATRESQEDQDLEFFEQDTEDLFLEVKDLLKKIKSCADDYSSKEGLYETIREQIMEMLP